jgi:hypothetical protein
MRVFLLTQGEIRSNRESNLGPGRCQPELLPLRCESVGENIESRGFIAGGWEPEGPKASHFVFFVNPGRLCVHASVNYGSPSGQSFDLLDSTAAACRFA